LYFVKAGLSADVRAFAMLNSAKRGFQTISGIFHALNSRSGSISSVMAATVADGVLVPSLQSQPPDGWQVRLPA
jgi:hypothetical protein